MPEATNNSAIEDGSAGSSPPPSSQSQSGGDSASAKSGETGVFVSASVAVDDSGAPISERAPGEKGLTQVDTLGDIYDELAAKNEQAKAPRSASPSSVENTTGDEPSAAAANSTTPATAAATNQDPKQSQRQTAEYDGLTADARGLLKNTGLLIPPESWNSLPEVARQSLMESARSIRSEKERLFQERKRGEGQQNQQQQQQQTQNQTPQAQGNQAQATPQQLEAAYTQLGTFGEDLVKPVRAIFEHQQQQFTGHIEKLTGQFKQQFDVSEAKIAFLLNRLEKSEEHAAFEGDELKTLKALPEFADKAVREEINRNARALLRAQFSGGNRDFTLKEGIVQAALTKFHDKLQQANQASLADSRKRSLTGTSSRPAAIVPTAKSQPKTESTVMDDVYEELMAKAK